MLPNMERWGNQLPKYLGKYFITRAHLFTSLMVELHQDKNRFSSLCNCLCRHSLAHTYVHLIFSFKAEEYLLNFDEDLFKDISTSGLVGILHNCTDVYGACQNVPNSYRFPGKSNLSTLSKYISIIDDEVVKTMKTHEEIP